MPSNPVTIRKRFAAVLTRSMAEWDAADRVLSVTRVLIGGAG